MLDAGSCREHLLIKPIAGSVDSSPQGLSCLLHPQTSRSLKHLISSTALLVGVTGDSRQI